MDKKNTMLLTVIAVATLLVAVVGATFAYFSISANSTVTNSRIEATIEDVGVIAVNPGTMPSLNLKAEHFIENNQPQEWHSSSDGTPQTSDQNIAVVKAGVTGGSTSVTYACTADVKVTLTGDYEGLNEHSDNAVLTIKTSGGVETTKIGESTASGTSVSLDFADYEDAKTYKLAFEVTGADKTGTSEKAILDADLVVKNTEEQQQSYLAGKTLGVQLAVDSVACAPKAGAGA